MNKLWDRFKELWLQVCISAGSVQLSVFTRAMRYAGIQMNTENDQVTEARNGKWSSIEYKDKLIKVNRIIIHLPPGLLNTYF